MHKYEGFERGQVEDLERHRLHDGDYKVIVEQPSRVIFFDDPRFDDEFFIPFYS